MQKRHHTIPCCYLDNFTDSDGWVWVLDTKNEIIRIRPKNILVENHFYRITLKDGSKSLVVENALSDIEGVYATIFREKIAKDIPLTPQERANVAVFVAAMLHRTRPHRENTRRMFETLKKNMEEWREQVKTITPEQRRTLNATPSGGGATITPEELDAGLEDFDELHAAHLIPQTMHTAQIIFNMKWAVLEIRDGGTTFVTSDSPLVVERPAAIKKFGRNAFGSRPGMLFEDAEATLPLSRDRMLLAGWILNQDSYAEMPSELAEQLNQRTILHSSQRLIASSKVQLEGVKTKYPPRSHDETI